jgi:arginine decarboxylase-like protein
VHVDINGGGRPQLSHFVAGDKVDEVLSYVEYFRSDLVASLRKQIELAIDEDRISLEDSGALLKRFEAGLSSYTYLMLPEALNPAPHDLEGGGA